MRSIKFQAEWCRPCRALDAELDKIPELDVTRVDVEEETGIAQLHRVRSVPTLILLDDEDKEVGRLVGRITASEVRKIMNYA